MSHTHLYSVKLNWTGNTGTGTASYETYKRDHVVEVNAKPVILLSSDPSFRGDANRYNPEELFLASLSSCHMLWFLHLCAVNDVVVNAYSDEATGTMEETDFGGRFTEVVLQPSVIVAKESMVPKANELHAEANRKCFIANSCNFPVLHRSVCYSEA